MSVPELIAAKVKDLPPEQQQEVLSFVEKLERPAAKPPLRSPKGIWKDLAFDITSEEIDEARKEMWGSFPRDIL